MTRTLKAGITCQRCDVLCAGIEIMVLADDFMTQGKQTLREVGAKKAGAAGNQDALT